MSLLRRLEITGTCGSAEGETSGATPVVVVPAPPLGWTRVVDCLRIANLDTAAITWRLRKDVDSTSYEFDSGTALAADGKAEPITPVLTVRLTDVNHSLSLVLDGAVATQEPEWVSGWYDVRNTE